MKKFVLTMMMVIAVGSLTTLQAAIKENTQAIHSRGVVEQITNRMTRQLGLSSHQAMRVEELNMEYDFLLIADVPMTMTDRQYRRAWDKYENKLRRILSAHQFTLYLSNRGALFAVAPRTNIPRAYVPRPTTPAPRAATPQRGNDRRPMASAPRGNGRGQDMQRPRQDNNRGPNVGNQRPQNDRQQDKADKPNQNDRRPDNGQPPQNDGPQKQGEL